MNAPPPERILTGQVASPGLAAGRIRLQRQRLAEPAVAGSPAEELGRLEAAIAAAAVRLGQLSIPGDTAANMLLEFQIAILEDAELIDPVRQAIAAGAPAATAWREVLDRQIAEYEAGGDSYFAARSADLADLRDRVLDALSGAVRGPGAEPMPSEGAIYVADDLAPSRFLEIDWRQYRGGALRGGSANSHVAILARARGVPLLIGLDLKAEEAMSGAEAILDAEEGRLILNPRRQTRARFARRIADLGVAAASAAEYLTRPATTRAGRRIDVMINVDEPGVVDGIDPAHCDGIGLTRTEFLFSEPPGLPEEERQFAVYARLIRWAKGRPVTIRTLDAGGDKPIAGLTVDGESNPFLGLRGIRLSLARPEIFRIQLRALARAAALGPLKVMLPMVTVPREVEDVRRLLHHVVDELSGRGISAAMPSLGMMVEVPAAAINVAAFDVDFYSIGSNDLVQYVTATSRDSAEVAALHDPLNPAVLELIGRVVAHGATCGRYVGLCGDMASDSRYLPALLDRGLASISVAPARLAQVKAEIARHG
ncbi:MAG: phosphoenolpyruvate-protein phosphotransferase system enzyme [Rhodospirillaceae bacterium]|nr:phosphoenolpyruvate-protein phosphotransferase system enzyme [Rhodospirillaceae bacterium]